MPPSAPRSPLRSAFPGWAVIMLMGLVGGACSKPSTEATPDRNVLLVTLSGTRADRLGCYGYEKAKTPYLDALATKGVRFENAYATSGLGPISQAAILTGRNNATHGLRMLSGELSHRLPGSVPSLPQILANRGWRTAGFVSSYLASNAFGLGRGYQQFRTGSESSPNRGPAATPVDPREWMVDARKNGSQRRSDATTDEALTWLEEHGKHGPWHLWLQYADLNDLALVPPRGFAEAAGVNYDDGQDPDALETRERLYDLELSYMDAQLGRLIEYLKNTGQEENTIIVVVADHGQGLSEGQENHGWSWQRLLYNWSLHVPMIVKLPDFPPGVVVPDLVRTIDVLPTVLEQVELRAPAPPDGRSLLPILRGELDEPRIAYADALTLSDLRSTRGQLPARNQDNLFMVMDQRWKLIHHRSEPSNSELFERLNDPHELENLYDSLPDVAGRLLRTLESHEAFRREPKAQGVAPPDAGRLEALGYGGDGN